MTQVEVRTRYVANDVWVTADMIGRQYIFVYEGKTVTVQLPSSPDDFQPGAHDELTPPTPALFRVATAQEPGKHQEVHALRLFCVRVTYDTDVPPEQPDVLDGGFSDVAREAWESGAKTADAVAEVILQWLRSTSRQSWLGIVAEPPRQYGRSGLYNAYTGVGLMGFGPTQKLTIRPAMLAMDSQTFDGMMLKVEAREPVPLARGMLADAWHLADGAEVQDPLRALLTAGIACEVHTKQTMRERVHPLKAEIFSELLRRTSNVDSLLDEVMQLAFGESLRASDKDLWLAVKNLKEQRNQVVHSGKTRDTLNIRAVLSTAEQLFIWLASHPTDQSV